MTKGTLRGIATCGIGCGDEIPTTEQLAAMQRHRARAKPAAPSKSEALATAEANETKCDD